MNPSDQEQWLVQHIPHRLRVCLAYSDLQEKLMPDTADQETRKKIGWHCVLTAAFEGRMAAIRWLIEFVGIRDRKGKPDRPNRHSTDVSITSIKGGQEIDLSSPEAAI